MSRHEYKVAGYRLQVIEKTSHIKPNTHNLEPIAPERSL